MATITEEPELQLETLDSGMASSEAHSPEVKSLLPEDDDEEDEEDETLVERLIGLTEMFPEGVRDFGYNSGVCITKLAKAFYSFSCSATWLVFSSSAILFAPLIFEIECAQMEEAQRNQQKQVLLGPNTANMSGAGPGQGGFPMAPPIQR